MTKKYHKLYLLFAILTVILNAGPLVYYVIKALVESNLTHEKIALCATVFVVLIMTGVSIINKVAYRSRLWIILLGLYYCLDYILAPLMIIAICQIVDELIVSPMKSHYKAKYTINKEIDARID